MQQVRTKKIRVCNGESIKIAILGDMDFSTWVDNGKNPLRLLKPLISMVDITIANIETVFSDRQLIANKPGILLKSPSRCADFLKEVGINYALLANNHIDDFGVEGIQDTIDALKRNKIDYFGLCERNNILVHKKGITFTLSGVGTPWQDTAIVPSYGKSPGCFFKKTSPNSHLLYFIHGFEELYSTPFPWRLELLRAISNELKPAALICGHSHCYQGWMNFNDKSVTCLSYGNGFMNLEYHSTANKLSKFGICTILHFDQDGCFQIDEHPYKITSCGIEPISQSDADELWHDLNIMHELTKNPKNLQNSWEEECFRKWRPQGIKDWPFIRRLYDCRRGLFPIKATDGIVYLRAMRAAYLKRQYGISSFSLREDEYIRMKND